MLNWYKPITGNVTNAWLIMSGGVAKAETSNIATIKYERYLTINSLLIKPALASITATIGNWKIIPMKAESLNAKPIVFCNPQTAPTVEASVTDWKNARLVLTTN